MSSEKSWVLVFVANEDYLSKAFQTVYEVRTTGQWTDDIILLTTAAIVAKPENTVLCTSLNANFRILPDQDFSKTLDFLNSKQQHENSHYVKHRMFQFMKFYVMDPWFKKWDVVFYMDAGVKVQGDLNRMKAACNPCYSLLAHSDSYPEYEKTLETQFEFSIDSDISERLLMTYNLKCDYFQSTILIFDTTIIEEGTVDRLFELMNLYPIMTRNDQSILNLHFICERGLWKPLEKADSIGFLYDFHERPGYTRSDYLLMKYPIKYLL